MVFGLSLGSPTCDNISPACPPLLRAVLESILTPEACKVGMPTVSQLLTQPFFHNVILNYDKATMKMSRKLKESLLDAKTRMEARIVQEQKLVSSSGVNRAEIAGLLTAPAKIWQSAEVKSILDVVPAVSLRRSLVSMISYSLD